MSETGLISILPMRLSASLFMEAMTMLEMFLADFTSLTMLELKDELAVLTIRTLSLSIRCGSVALGFLFSNL